MPKLSYPKLKRLVELLNRHELTGTRYKYRTLKQLAVNEDIKLHKKQQRIIKRFLETGRIDNKPSTTRPFKHTKITKRKLAALDELVFENRNMNLQEI